MDPGLVGLLEGSAFMAARVQLKLKSEFARIHVRAARPAPAELPGADPVGDAGPGDAALRRSGPRRGQALRARRLSSTRSMSSRSAASPAASGCATDLALWPLHLEMAEYYAAPAPLQALGLEVAPGVASGMRLGFRRLSATARAREGRQRRQARRAGQGCQGRRPAGPSPRTGQRCDRSLRAALRQLPADHAPLPRFVRRPAVSWPLPLRPARADRLRRERDAVRDATTGSSPASSCCATSSPFRTSSSASGCAGCASCWPGSTRRPSTSSSNSTQPCRALQSVVSPAMFALYAVPVANLFEMNCSRVPVRRRRARASRRPRPQPLARLRGPPHHRRLRALSGPQGEGAGLSALQPADREHPPVRRALLHGAPAAAPATRRRSGVRAR